MARKVASQGQPADLPHLSGYLSLTKHALRRQDARRISDQAVLAALYYGRAVSVRGVIIYAIGRREVERQVCQGVDLTPFEGIHVVCAKDGAVVTVYRNRDLRNLKSQRRSRFF